MTTYGIHDYATIAGTIAATSALQTQMQVTNAATMAVGNSILPPGVEAASALADVGQKTSNMDFGTKLSAGVTELMRRGGVMGTHTAQMATTDAAGAAGFAAINTAL